MAFKGGFGGLKWRTVFGNGRAVAFLLLIALGILRPIDPIPLEIMRVKTFDLYQTIKPREVVQRPVTIVDLDEASLAEIGQWPWPRTIIAEMVDRLTAMGAILVAFDIVFAEPDRLSPALLADTLPDLDDETRARLRAQPSNDRILAEAIERGRVVMGQTVLPSAQDRHLAGEPTKTSVAIIGEDPLPMMERHRGLLRNIPILDEAAQGRGLFTVSPDIDGIVRKIPMVTAVDGVIYPSLSLEILRVATGNVSIAVRSRTEGIEGVIVRPNFIPTDERGRVWVYYSKMDHDKYVSAKDVLNGSVDPARIANRLILIGTSAAGLLDIKSTPVERFMPGVEVHAQLIENVLENKLLHRPLDAMAVELSAALAGGLLMIVLLPLVGARWTLALAMTVAASLAAGSWWYYANRLTLYDPVFPILATILIYIYLTYVNYSREEAQRRQVRGAFSRYMSPALVERLAADPSQLKLGGEMREMTLMFCDVRGFTAISEQFDAEGLTKLINRFLTPMTDVILERRGTIDKYMGDCIMAFWNAPLDDETHAANACASALAMKERLAAVNAALEKEAADEGRKHIPLNIGIGLNTGTVCVGNMGSDQRFDYSVLGDEVNLASRLEGQSKTYGVTIVVGENTVRKVPDWAVLELDLIRVKGKSVPVRIFTVLGDPDFAARADFKELAENHAAMLAAYRAQEWDEAERRIALCRERAASFDPPLELNGLYDLFKERIEEFRATPPGDDWDGVFVATSK